MTLSGIQILPGWQTQPEIRQIKKIDNPNNKQLASSQEKGTKDELGNLKLSELLALRKDVDKIYGQCAFDNALEEDVVRMLVL